MIKNVKKDEFGLEGTMYCSLWDCDIDVNIDPFSGEDEVSDEEALAYGEKCAEAFNSLSDKTVEILCKAAKAYCLDFMESCGDDFDDDMTVPIKEDTDPREILKCIQPKVFIPELPDEEQYKGCIGYHVECNCDWEIEHGLEFTVRDGNILYVGDFSDNSPWMKYSEDKFWNYINSLK